MHVKKYEPDYRFRDIPLEEFDRMIQINLRAPFLLVQGVVEGMKAQHWGRIVFVSSIAAYGAGINGARKCHSPFLTFVLDLCVNL